MKFNESNFRNKPYLADFYEYASFLGDINRQIANLPDVTPIRLEIKP